MSWWRILLVPVGGWILSFVVLFILTNIFLPISNGIFVFGILAVPFLFFLGILFRRCHHQSVGRFAAIVQPILYFVIGLIPMWIAFAISERIQQEEMKYLLPGYLINVLPIAVVGGILTGLIYLGVDRFILVNRIQAESASTNPPKTG